MSNNLTSLDLIYFHYLYIFQQDALEKVNRVKEIRRRGKDGLKINRQQHFARKEVLFMGACLTAPNLAMVITSCCSS